MGTKLNKISLSVMTALAVTAAAGSNVAYAQEAAAASGAEEEAFEIISISRKRPESIQEVPIATTALSEKDIQDAGIVRTADFIGLIPNVSIVDAANVGDTQVNIRGITSTRDAEGTFAYVVDGVLQTNPNGFSETLMDVAQIEVLKGPQGALYGRNAVAGAILVTTKTPSDVTEGKFEIGVGNNNSLRLNGMITGEVASDLYGSFVASHTETDGFYRNDFLNRDDVVDFLEDTSFRGRLMYEGIEDFTLDVRAAYSEVSGGAINFNAVFALPTFEQILQQQAFFADVNDHDFIFAFNVPGENEQETTEFSVKADWNLETVDVTAIFAYNDLEEYLLSDGTSASFYGYELTPQCQADRATLNNAPGALGGADRTDLFGEFFAPFGVFPPGVDFQGVYGPYTPTSCDGFQYQERSQEDYSAEVRFASNDSSADLRWIAGAYAAQIERDVVVAYGADTGQGFLRQPYVPPSGPNPTDLLFDDTFDTTVLSVFGQVEYDVNDQWELAFALRYDNEDREVSNNVPNVSASGLNVNVQGPINPAFGVNPGGIPDRSRSFSQWQPKLTVSYAATDDINWYASYGVGFRSGGFNSIGTEATLNFWFNQTGTGNPGDAVNAQLLVSDEYDKEVTTAIELGVKSTWLDKRLKINAALFDTQVEDNQFFEFFAGPFGLLRAVTTIEELEIRGFEMDVNFKVTDALTAFAGIGLIDSEIQENRNRPLSVGNEAPQTPDRSATLGLLYEKEVWGDWLMTTRIDYQYVGETPFHTLQGEQTPTIWDLFDVFGDVPYPQDFSRAVRESYGLLNARINFDNGAWNVAVWANNLTDEQFLQEVIPAPEFGGSFVHPSALRAYGIDVSYRF